MFAARKTDNVSSAANYIEEVFSTFLYTGNGSTQTITNGIDLAGEGGMVWVKSRSGGYDNYVFDTARGAGTSLVTNKTNAQTAVSDGVTSFTTTGFGLSQNGYFNCNDSGQTFASWTFREQAKFFDVVTYTGTGVARTVAHNLGSVPGCIIVKRTDTTGAWQVYHRSLANTQYLVLNTTAGAATGTGRWNSTTPTDTVFSLGTDATVNANGGTYVAYLFAHDAGGFGPTGSDNVVTCGTYLGSNHRSKQVVTLGYEPQCVFIKNITTANQWVLVDNMRGMADTGSQAWLAPNSAAAETTTASDQVVAASTGFFFNGTQAPLNEAGSTFIYIAIRRGPMKTPTSGTSVFAMDTQSSFATNELVDSNFPPDQFFAKDRVSTGTWYSQSRLTGGYLSTNSTAAETSPSFWFFNGAGGKLYANTSYTNTPIYYLLGRAPGFFDVVCYTGTGSTRTITHNLSVTPELVITKSRSQGLGWVVWTTSLTSTDYWIRLDDTMAQANSPVGYGGTFSASSYTIANTGPYGALNTSGATYVAYLFASVTGVSKVGSYTGNGSSQTINCGFTAGARFVMIKRTDSTGDWYVWDTARGIVSGNDPRLSLNTTAAEVTTDDSIDPDNSGFIVNQLSATNINVNAATYIFLAIA